MVIAPVSLTFLSVPVSSSALACPAQNAAARPRPIIPRRFINALSSWMTAATLASFAPRSCNGRAIASARAISHRLIGVRIGGIGRLGEFVFQLAADRRVEVQSLGRDLLGEPLVVEFLALAALVQRGCRAVDHLL